MNQHALAWLKATQPVGRARKVGRYLAHIARPIGVANPKRHVAAGDVCCWVSARRIAKRTELSIVTVKRALADLIALGLERRRGARSNTYVFPEPPKQGIRQGLTPEPPPDTLGDTLGDTLPDTPYVRTDVKGRSGSAASDARAREPRLTCTCGNSWPASYGNRCKVCGKQVADPDAPAPPGPPHLKQADTGLVNYGPTPPMGSKEWHAWKQQFAVPDRQPAPKARRARRRQPLRTPASERPGGAVPPADAARRRDP